MCAGNDVIQRKHNGGGSFFNGRVCVSMCLIVCLRVCVCVLLEFSRRPGSYKEGNSSDQADWSPVNNSLQD